MVRIVFIGIILLSIIGALCVLVGTAGVFLLILETIKQERYEREQKQQKDQEYEGLKESLLRHFEHIV